MFTKIELDKIGHNYLKLHLRNKTNNVLEQLYIMGHIEQKFKNKGWFLYIQTKIKLHFTLR